jgi:hypothetical protein
MHATLYVTAVPKMSCRGDTKETSEHRNIHNGYSTVLTEFRSVMFWLFLCADECSGDRQCKWASDGVTLLKVFWWIVCVWRKVANTNFRYICNRMGESSKIIF